MATTVTTDHVSTTNPGHWLDVMPAIPLVSAVPVVFHPGSGCRAVVVALTDARHRDGRAGRVVVWDGISAAAWRSTSGLRVDLGDPQGFAYALGWWARQGATEGPSVLADWQNMSRRALLHLTTDADRLALARALAEVAGRRGSRNNSEGTMATTVTTDHVSTTTPGHWLDVMPAIPLAPSVPVHELESGGNRGIVLELVDDGARVDVSLVGVVPFDWCRVDLDDPQGFAYALRWLVVQVRTNDHPAPESTWAHRMQHEEKEHAAARMVFDRVDRDEIREAAWDQWERWMTQAWSYDAITDADRLALARALAEVVR